MKNQNWTNKDTQKYAKKCAWLGIILGVLASSIIWIIYLESVGFFKTFVQPMLANRFNVYKQIGA